LAWVKDLLPKDKYDKFEELVRTPISTNELTQSIFNELSKVFDANDRHSKYEFVDSELESDVLDFFAFDNEFWSIKGLDALRNGIDSVLIVDLPKEQIGERTEPYYYFLSPKDIIDIENNSQGDCEYIIFRQGSELVAVIDEEFYRLFDVNSGVLASDPKIEVAHGLGYTPARSFWSKNIEKDNYINKESPLTSILYNLDWLLVYDTSAKYNELWGSWPILATYSQNEDFETSKTDEIKSEGDPSVKGENKKKFVGAGTYVEFDAPENKEDADLLKNPVQIVAPETDSLKIIDQKLDEKKNYIFCSVVGQEAQVKNDAAKNELQIKSTFESKKNVLLNIAKNFETIHTFGNKTVCRLRYGDLFLNCNISYGTEFYIKTVADYQEELMSLSGKDVPITLLKDVNDQLIQTKYKNNQDKKMYLKILEALDPFPMKSDKELFELVKNGVIKTEDFLIKIYLFNFVNKFERENLPLNEFGLLIPFDKKINIIKEKFKDYAKEKSNDASQPGQQYRDTGSGTK